MSLSWTGRESSSAVLGENLGRGADRDYVKSQQQMIVHQEPNTFMAIPKHASLHVHVLEVPLATLEAAASRASGLASIITCLPFTR